MNFKSQVKRAKAINLNRQWVNERRPTGILSDGAYYKQSMSGGAVKRLSDKAYKAKRGYSIAVNPKTGKKEMFVRGTTFRRGGLEWAQNLLESPFGGVASGTGAVASALSRRSRGQYSKFLSSVAKKNNVDVVYGHSRGAAVVQDMSVPGIKKIALDGATILNSRSTITNVRQKQAFDWLIGANSKKSVVETRWTPLYKKRYHSVYR